jgi:Na+-transporting methylmalonyl-CoA/oxaloacetate decarboxylase gamma subunit
MLCGGYNVSWDGMVLMLLGIAFSLAFLVVLVWALINWLPRKASAAVPPSPASTLFSQSA